jgi:hypothetical protein
VHVLASRIAALTVLQIVHIVGLVDATQPLLDQQALLLAELQL